MHKWGINAWYLGWISTIATYNHVWETAVIEIIAWCIKSIIRDGLALTQEDEKSSPTIFTS